MWGGDIILFWWPVSSTLEFSDRAIELCVLEQRSDPWMPQPSEDCCFQVCGRERSESLLCAYQFDTNKKLMKDCMCIHISILILDKFL